MVINVDGAKINSRRPFSHGFCFHFCYFIVSISPNGKQIPYYLTHNYGKLFRVFA
nr:MAG TPA: hypothetical protein [Caudoviricetes sp.]